jgi:hypothetical protein
MKPHMPLPTTRKGRQHLDQTALEIQVDALSEDAIQGLVEDWLVPMIVDQFIETVLKAGI